MFVFSYQLGSDNRWIDGHFLPGLSQAVSADRFDEFLKHSEVCRKTGDGLLATTQRTPARRASHDGELSTSVTRWRVFRLAMLSAVAMSTSRRQPESLGSMPRARERPL